VRAWGRRHACGSCSGTNQPRRPTKIPSPNGEKWGDPAAELVGLTAAGRGFQRGTRGRRARVYVHRRRGKRAQARPECGGNDRSLRGGRGSGSRGLGRAGAGGSDGQVCSGVAGGDAGHSLRSPSEGAARRSGAYGGGKPDGGRREASWNGPGPRAGKRVRGQAPAAQLVRDAGGRARTRGASKGGAKGKEVRTERGGRARVPRWSAPGEMRRGGDSGPGGAARMVSSPRWAKWGGPVLVPKGVPPSDGCNQRPGGSGQVVGEVGRGGGPRRVLKSNYLGQGYRRGLSLGVRVPQREAGSSRGTTLWGCSLRGRR